MVKFFLKIKFTIATLLIASFLFLSTISYAEEKSVFTSTRDSMYQLISDYEYCLTPLFDAIAGGFLCGPWCSIGGAILGGIDEALVYYKYADRRYLTHGVMGAANGFMVSPTSIGAGIGTVVGFLLPQGTFTNHPELIAPAVSVVAAGSTLGLPGAIGGAIAGGIDELLLHMNIFDKHYLTAISLGKMGADAFFSPEVANFVAAGIGLVGANWEQQICDNFAGPLKVVTKVKEMYDKFLPPKQLNSHIEKHGIALIGTQLLAQLISLKSVSIVGGLRNNFENINNLNLIQWNGFRNNALYFAVFLVPAALSQFATSYVDSYYNNKLYRQLHDEVHTELYEGKNSLRMYHNESYSQQIDNLENNLQIMVHSGNAIASGSFSTAIQGAYGVGMIIVSAPNLAVYSAAYNRVKTWISQYIAHQYGVHDNRIMQLESDLATLKKDYLFNIMTIAERDGAKIARGRIGDLTDQLREEENKKQLWLNVNSAWSWTTLSANSVIDYFCIAKEIRDGRVQFANKNKMRMAGNQLAALFSLPGNLAYKVDETARAMEKIVVLEGMIHAPLIGNDQIERIYDNTEKQGITIQNLAITTSDKLLIEIDELNLEMGKIYAITGNNGCGKSSLLSKIKGVKDNGIGGTGEIHYPLINGKEPKVVMIGKDYLPPNYTLQEIIFYPEIKHEANQEQYEEIIYLLTELGLNEYIAKLDSHRNWDTLSTGEKKKISLISAIIKKPDILIIDETLANLDPESTQKTSKILKKYLPNSLILIVDHEAWEHNIDNFYDQELHFDSQTQTAILRDPPTT